jgi:hypothetical protein
MLRVIILSAIELSVVLLTFIMLRVIKSVSRSTEFTLLSVIILSVVMLKVAAPQICLSFVSWLLKSSLNE